MEQIVILDFGSQYTQVIARRIRECNVYSVILGHDTPAVEIAALAPRGIILSGGPSSVYAKNAPLADRNIFALGVPVLGICYGVQLFAQFLGGKVEKGLKREYGKGVLTVKDASCTLFRNLPKMFQVWNSHGDKLTKLPRDFKSVAVTENSEYAAIENRREIFRPAISSRSRPHTAGEGNHFQFCPRHLWLWQKLDRCGITWNGPSRKSAPGWGRKR